jgi:hypothetical protein
MKKLIAVIMLVMLTACSSFKVGGMIYCPQERDCKFEQTVHDTPK